jgi:hypothetical protein
MLTGLGPLAGGVFRWQFPAESRRMGCGWGLVGLVGGGLDLIGRKADYL